MKKTYQSPITKVMNVKLQQMIAGSEQLGFGEKVSTAAGADSRRGGAIWDDDDEE